MKLKDGLLIALLATGCPLLLFASTLTGSAVCKVDGNQVYPVGSKSDSWPLLVLAGIAQGVGAYRLIRGQQREEGEGDRPTPQSLLTPTTPPVEMPQQHQDVELEPVHDAFSPTVVYRPASMRQPAKAAEPGSMAARREHIQQRNAIAHNGHEPPPEYTWVKDLLHYPAVLVYGAQGSGKTSFVAWLLRQRIRAGHTAEVWDPHRAYGQWEGLRCYGDGMNYEAIDYRMLSFANTVTREYKARATDPSFDPKPHTIVAEEVTNWGSRCENSAEFFTAALSDIRKIKKCVIFVAHDRTLAALGGAKGVSKARDASMLELELEAKVDPVTGEAAPALKGRLKYPGKQPVEVQLSSVMKGDMDFTDVVFQHVEGQQSESFEYGADYRAKLEGLISDSPDMGGNFSEGSGNRGNSDESSISSADELRRKIFPDLPETAEIAIFQMVNASIGNGKGKTWIVQEVLGCKGRKYADGCSYYDYLLRRYGNGDT